MISGGFFIEVANSIGLTDLKILKPDIAVCAAAVAATFGLAMELSTSDVGSEDEKRRLYPMYSQTPECRKSASPKGVTVALQRAAIDDRVAARDLAGGPIFV
ncbi:hypothetical protein [Altererythrobacter aquiaggeris]|uniref:hypothetical protein n=1 Tax=Aestuarierythrobacter aquiaggeris TaxID=1898396 RepID=UPI003018997C